jgi:hypothetical protein
MVRPVSDIETPVVSPVYMPRISAEIPTEYVTDTPLVTLEFNENWLPHIIGVLESLDQPDSWVGTFEQIETARAQIRAMIAEIPTEIPSGDTIIDIDLADGLQGLTVNVGTFATDHAESLSNSTQVRITWSAPNAIIIKELLMECEQFWTGGGTSILMQARPEGTNGYFSVNNPTGAQIVQATELSIVATTGVRFQVDGNASASDLAKIHRVRIVYEDA